MRRKSYIGRGRRMSIAKAALVVFEAGRRVGDLNDFIYSGESLEFFHDAIDVAGAKHIGPGTHWQVLACIRTSPYWEAFGETLGFGNRRANTYRPSFAGEQLLLAREKVCGGRKDTCRVVI